MLDQDLTILGEKVTLVPVPPEHVPKYHQWMQVRALRANSCKSTLTSSESDSDAQAKRNQAHSRVIASKVGSSRSFDTKCGVLAVLATLYLL
jgi:hypothetical protein